MRPKRTLREFRPLHVAAGAIVAAVPSAGVALASANQADAQPTLPIATSTDHVALGGHVRVTGQAPAADAGDRAELEFLASGAAAWRPVAATMVAPGGRLAVQTTVRESGQLRVVVGSGTASAQGSTSASGGAASAAATAMTSLPTPIHVTPRFVLTRRATVVMAGSAAVVRGRLLPGVRGRRVRLLERSGGGWRSVASTHTGARGSFALRLRGSAAAGRMLRVAFGGDARNTASSIRAGRVQVLEPSVASWYDDAGSTACGFHAGYGVANLSLPCGTRVTFRYGGRTVTATVDDRGPYVGGREWDLNQNTAAALGFAGVGTVWASA